MQDSFWSAAASAFSNSSLHLTILPTEKCNLHCSYCYETFNVGKMKSDTIEALKRFLARRINTLEELQVDWFGGEPLLAAEIIEEVNQYIISLTNTNPTLLFSSSVTTNGVLLTTKLASRLRDCNVRLFHISLDGAMKEHDLTRSTANGKGTYATLEKNLFDIRSSDIDCKVVLRIHVTPLNYNQLDAFTEFVSKEFLVDPRFTAYFFPILDLGGAKEKQSFVLTQDKAKTIVADLSSKLRRIVQESSSDSLQKTSTSSTNAFDCKLNYICYAAKPNAWIIRSDGKLSKCTVGLDDPRNYVGELEVDGTLNIASDALPIWLRGWENGEQSSLHCPYEDLRDDVRSGKVESRKW